jgi:Leucine-rich repeat (LRR) protein
MVDAVALVSVLRLQSVSTPDRSLFFIIQLAVDNNALEVLPALPSGLETLSVSHNQLPAVGSEITVCRRLKVLDVSFNTIVALPSDVASLTSLEELNADHNHIESLATIGSGFAAMVHLQVVVLSHNRITATPEAIPASLFTDTRLHRLQLQGNPAIMNQSQLQVLPGFEVFLARRKERIDKGIAVSGPDRLCGL